ncbi:uncharacterized protein LOC106640596 isoform X2 [Copidosoma floridanum]|nr:uncharacterized protein LOC106640596 isoform X2 [Copidosoma floridanum]
MSQKGEEIPISSIPGCNDPSVARDTMNSYLAQRRRKKKRKQEGGGGKWPRAYSIDSRSLDDHSEDNRSLDYGHKEHDESSEAKRRAEHHANHHIGSPLPQHQLVHPVVEHNAGTALITDSESEPHLHNLMPMQPYSPLHIPQFPGAIQTMSYPASAVAAAATVGVAAVAVGVSTPSGTSTPHSNSSSTTPSQSSTGAKIRGASDCPGVCPLCGATLRQARNLRRHLLSSCKYRFTANPNQQQQQHQMMPADSMSIEVKPDVSVSGYGSGGAGSQGSAESASSSCEQIVCNPSPLPSPSPQGEWNSKSRTLSDQPATCPLCGAVIRQSRNLRRHLELLHFGAGAGKSGTKSKKDKSDKSFAPRSSPAYSKASLTALRESMHAKASTASHSSMPSLNLSTSSSASSINVPRSSALGSSSHHLHHHHAHAHGHGGHHTPNTNPAHTIPAVTHPPSSIAPPNNGIYSAEGASMLSTLFPSLPTLPTLSSPHDVFRHSEFLRANMGYSPEAARQQHANRHLQRADVT